MADRQKRFGTFSGVFVPNVLTIFGVILFYREGWLVGNAGLLGAILVIVLANLITICTALSMAAIVTNIKVRGGGAYYLVSRSLGPEIGGAIGITLFFAQTFSISFYIIGFVKAIHAFLPQVDELVLNSATLLLLMLLSIFSAEAAIRAQYLILAMVLLALFSFFAGNTGFAVSSPLMGKFPAGNFWKSFAIFFPAVTGIFAGLSLSGDLKQPNRNIPRGTLLAIGFTFVFYILVAIWFAHNFSSQQLLTNDGLMHSSSRFPWMVTVGICAATISSAIGVLLGAPRTLQALGVDSIVPPFLARGSGPAREPRIAMLVSVVLAWGLFTMGGIDFISQLLTMFFLASYGIVNLIAALEVLLGNPNFRPQFRVPWAVSLLGAVGSFVIMFLIDQLATLVALVAILGLYFYLTRRRLQSQWGDIRKGFWAAVMELALTNYERFEHHPRTWRPHIAVFENDAHNRSLLAGIACGIGGKGGLISHYVFHDDYLLEAQDGVDEELMTLRAFLRENGFHQVHPEIVYTNHDKNAHLIALQADGIGSFKANTIVSDFTIGDNSLEEHFSNLRSYEFLQKNIILVKDHSDQAMYDNRIDVWLSGFKANVSMLLMVPFLLTRHPDWNRTRIVLHMIVKDETVREHSLNNLTAILENARIEAQVDIISLASENAAPQESQAPARNGENSLPSLHRNRDRDREGLFLRLFHFFGSVDQSRYAARDRGRIKQIIKERSRDARLVVMGMNIPEKGAEKSYAAEMKRLLKDLPLTLLVKGIHNINVFK